MTTKENKTLDQKIQEWKEKYGGVYEFPVDDKVCYLRIPTMADYKRVFNAMDDEGEVGFGEEMLRALWLEGDEDIRKDDDYFIPARKKLTKFLKYPDAEITELADRKFNIKIQDAVTCVRVITREDIKTAERKNPSSKPFVTQEKLYELIKVGEHSAEFDNKEDAEIRMPLYKAIEELQNRKVAQLKKL